MSLFLLEEASSILDAENIKRIAGNKELMLGDVFEEIANDWVIQKQAFYKQTGLEEDEAYEQELEQLLLEHRHDDEESNED